MSSQAEALRGIGMTSRQASAHADVLARLDESLDAAGAGPDRWSAWVPGRIEIFGKHTDYAGGRSLLCAVERGFCVRAAARDDRAVRIVDVSSGESHVMRLDAAAAALSPGDWRCYIDAVVRRVARNFARAVRGADMAFSSDLPKAAGMSSSSALVTAAFLVLARANALHEIAEYQGEIQSQEDLAAYLGCVENGQSFGGLRGDAGVGTIGGSEDHVAILCSRAGHAVQYAFLPVRREGEFPLDESHVFVIASSGVAAEKTAAARERYNRLSRMTSELLAQWNRTTGRSDPSLGAASASAPDAKNRLRAMAAPGTRTGFDGRTLRERLEQFLIESFELVPAAGAAFASADWTSLGRLAERSRRLAEVALGNQIPETVALADSAGELGAAAASPFGAGFGGSVWALVPTPAATDFVERWSRWYQSHFPNAADAAEFFVTRAGPGAHVW